MAGAAIGLQSHIWNNTWRSILLLGSYPFIIGGIVWACAFLFGLELAPENPSQFATNIIDRFWPVIFAVVFLWFGISFFFHTRMIRKLARSHPVTRKEEPALYNLLENLCISQGMPMPHLEIIESHARNAFASGIDQKSYAITLTRGLLNSLTRDEVEAVLAHELTHILNRDVRLLIITIIFTGMIGFAADLVWNNLRYRSYSSDSKGKSAALVFGLALVLSTGYLLTLFTRFALSRSREYMADAGAVEITKNPDAMMRALKRIAGRADIPKSSQDIAMMCIENKKKFLGLFATHPPIERRIKAIAQTTNTPIPEITGAPAGKEESFGDHEHKQNPWLIRQRHSHSSGKP